MHSVRHQFRSSVAVLLLTVHVCMASSYANLSDPDNPHDPKPWSPQYTDWYPQYAAYLTDISTNACNETWQDYLAAFNAPRSPTEARELGAYCVQHESCLFSNMDPRFLVYYQSALVVLGLLPTLLSFVGPSVEEMSLLYAHRPLLSTLLVLGAPTISTARYFSYETPELLVISEDGKQARPLLGPIFGTEPLTGPLVAFLTVGEYLWATVAAISVIVVVFELGQRSILVWSCTAQFAPLLWATLPLLVHILAAMNYYYLVLKREKVETSVEDGLAGMTKTTTKGGKRKGFWFYNWLLDEVKLCVNREGCEIRVRREPEPAGFFAQWLNIVVGGTSLTHFIYGTVTLSSLQFVGLSDTFVFILVPLAVSASTCRLIMLIELTGLASAVARDRQDQSQSGSVSESTGLLSAAAPAPDNRGDRPNDEDDVKEGSSESISLVPMAAPEEDRQGCSNDNIAADTSPEPVSSASERDGPVSEGHQVIFSRRTI